MCIRDSIHALREAPPAERKAMLKVIGQKRKSPAEARRVADFAIARGGLDYARARMLAHADDARRHARMLPPSPGRDALVDLVTFAVERRR